MESSCIRFENCTVFQHMVCVSKRMSGRILLRFFSYFTTIMSRHSYETNMDWRKYPGFSTKRIAGFLLINNGTLQDISSDPSTVNAEFFIATKNNRKNVEHMVLRTSLLRYLNSKLQKNGRDSSWWNFFEVSQLISWCSSKALFIQILLIDTFIESHKEYQWAPDPRCRPACTKFGFRQESIQVIDFTFLYFTGEINLIQHRLTPIR